MQSANLSGPFRGCLYYALLGLPQATGLAGGYDLAEKEGFEPSRRSTRPTPLAGEPLRPLGYFSKSNVKKSFTKVKVAERVGFEPTALSGHRFSRPAP